MSNEHITDEQIHDLATELELDDPRADLILFARAILALRPAAQPSKHKHWSGALADDLVASGDVPAAQPVGGLDSVIVSAVVAQAIFFKEGVQTVEQLRSEIRAILALRPTPQPVAVPDRVPMTDEQILQGKNDRGAVSLLSFMKGVRHAEAHHGITTPKADK